MSDLVRFEQGNEAVESVATAQQVGRVTQEVQAAMAIARSFPRNMTAAAQRIKQSCKRPKLAETAIYSYPRGGQQVEGPSIRLAEEMARQWGNIDFGIHELEQKAGESTVMAYCWDLETNTRQTKIFTVPHVRHTKRGSQRLTDPRDIYEMVANQGARRLRACILGVIPGDVTEEAVEECNRTLAGQNAKPLADRVRDMVIAFADLGVTQSMIERRLGHNLEATSEAEVVMLGKAYTSIRDGYAGVTDHFEYDETPEQKQADTKTAKVAQDVKQKAASKPRRNKATKKAQPEPQAQDDGGKDVAVALFDEDPKALASEFRTRIAAADDVKSIASVDADVRLAWQDGVLPDPVYSELLDELRDRKESLK
ncbi:MAG: hypothetical protein ACPHJ3_04805 [Rubripirellula sp.]